MPAPAESPTAADAAQHPDRGAAGADPARAARCRPGPGDRGVAGVRARSSAARTSSCPQRSIPTRERRAGGGAARSGGQHPRSAPAVRCGARRARAPRHAGEPGRPVGSGVLRQHAGGGRVRAAPQARADAARIRRRGTARHRCRHRFRGAQPAARHGREPGDVRGGVRAAAPRGQGARAHLPRRAVSDAGLDRERCLAQQHRLRPGSLDRPAPHLRAPRRRRPVPHPLRPLARHSHGAGLALGVPVPEGQRLQLPDRRAFTSKARSSMRAASPPGATVARPCSAATGTARAPAPIRPSS